MCPTCGSATVEGRRFCTTCGTDLSAAPPPAPYVPPAGPGVDYAVPASLPAPARADEPRLPLRLWGGRPRLLVMTGAWVLAVLLLLPVLVPLLSPEPTGADSPEEAVGQLLQGIADLDAIAIVRAVDPDEAGDLGRAEDAYDDLADRVTRRGDEPAQDVQDVVDAATDQLGGSVDREALATLAAVDLDLSGLELDTEDLGDGRARVYLRDGDLDVTVDRDRLPASVADEVPGLDRARYSMPLAEGWRRDGEPFDAYLVTVERDGRWYVSLVETSADLFSTEVAR